MKRVLAGAAVRLIFYLSLGRQLLAESHLCDTWSAQTATTDSALLSCRVTPLAFATLCHLQLMPTLSALCRLPSSHSRWLPLLTLLLCGDVECNPGPRRLKYPCGSCQRAVMSNQPGVQCEVCYLWYHCRCLGLTSVDYSELQQSDDPWCCPPCFKQALPFHNCSSISNNCFPSVNSSIPDPENSQIDPPISSHSRQYCSIMYCNCRSLTPKLDALRVQAAASSPDIIALTETWLDPSISSSEIFIPGYTSIRRDRN